MRMGRAGGLLVRKHIQLVGEIGRFLAELEFMHVGLPVSYVNQKPMTHDETLRFEF